MDTWQGGAWGKLVRRTLVFLAITFGLFLLLEGAASFALFLRALHTETRRLPPVFGQRAYTTFDPELGWVSEPNTRIDHFYGPGKHIVINGQGFRDEQDFTREVPPGKQRVICSGDSFTFGYGVANRETWCAQLATLNPNLETVNMGQGGYGVGQAYLWYLRDGLELKHDVQILAFIEDDFRRTSTRRFLGYSKPLLVLEEGRQLRIIPASPHNSAVRRWLAVNGGLLGQLRSLEFLGQALRKLGLGTENWRTRTWEVVEAIFDDLAEEHRLRGSKLVLVLLPNWDFAAVSGAYWGPRITDYARRTGVSYVDLLGESRAMGLAEAQSLFFPAPGHLNEKGNLWVARRLAIRLPSLLAGDGRPNEVRDSVVRRATASEAALESSTDLAER